MEQLFSAIRLEWASPLLCFEPISIGTCVRHDLEVDDLTGGCGFLVSCLIRH